MRGNARRRKILFEITLEQFSELCFRTYYLVGKGRTKEGLSIDRVDPTKGYTIDNIRVISTSENSAKGATDKLLIYDWITKYGRYVSMPRDIDNSKNYF